MNIFFRFFNFTNQLDSFNKFLLCHTLNPLQ